MLDLKFLGTESRPVIICQSPFSVGLTRWVTSVIKLYSLYIRTIFVSVVVTEADQGAVSLSTMDCPTGRRTILPCYLSIAEWSESVVLIETAPWYPALSQWLKIVFCKLLRVPAGDLYETYTSCVAPGRWRLRWHIIYLHLNAIW